MSRPDSLQSNVPLAPYTTLQIGGPATFFARVTTVAELEAVYRYARAEQLPVTILGGGSNVLIADEGIAGVVVQIALTGRTVQSESDDAVVVTYAAGESFDAVVADTVAEGWWGLENLSHIPGTVGATPIQNVGAYGVEVSDHVQSVTVFDLVEQTVSELSAAECGFGYRTSCFKQAAGKRYVVTAVTFVLSKQPRPQLTYKDLQPLAEQSEVSQADIRQAVIAVRAQKFPDWHRVGTAGSFFKNPTITAEQYQTLSSTYPDMPVYPTGDGAYKVALGWILDVVCGYKGYRVGTVGTYERQALVLINYGGATAAEVFAFASEIETTVYNKTNIAITWEVTPLP